MITMDATMQGVLRSNQGTRQNATTSSDDEVLLLTLSPPRAFEQLYRRYIDAVFGYCYRRLGSREAAEDATSLIFTKAFAALPSFRSGSFRSWLFTIAYHVITDDLRARRANADLDLAVEMAALDLSPEDQAIANERDRALRAAISRLPESQRQVVELRLAGLNGREIAEVLGRGLPAVKMAQLRAYARLRDQIVDDARTAGND
jgi:RNA polymerase sigma-70 factor (ECF subfamily)